MACLARCGRGRALSHGGRSAVRCAGRARGRGTERPRTALERGQEAPAPAPAPRGCGSGPPSPCPFPFPPVLSFAMTAAAGIVRLPPPSWDCREILFQNRALSLPCRSSCCFLSLRWVGCLIYKTNLENIV
ncbi:hypothetical protein Nmel_006300 [Mimus melanotis]